MDKIRLLTNGGYGDEVCQAGDILEVTEWYEDGCCDAYVPSEEAPLYFYPKEFEKVENNSNANVEGLYVLLYDESRVSGPYCYQEYLEEFYRAVRSGNIPKICKLTFLD